jgi:hypothetical protein
MLVMVLWIIGLILFTVSFRGDSTKAKVMVYAFWTLCCLGVFLLV